MLGVTLQLIFNVLVFLSEKSDMTYGFLLACICYQGSSNLRAIGQKYMQQCFSFFHITTFNS